MTRDELQKLLLYTFGNLNDKQLLALTIYAEARGEGRDGMIAVGSVILERCEHRSWDGDTIQSVCLMPYQFSCFLPTDPNFIALKMMALSFDSQYARSISLQQCYGVAAGLIDGTIARTPAISAHHICQYVEENYRQKIDGVAKIAVGQKLEKINGSRWWIRMKLVTQVGHHEFYV